MAVCFICDVKLCGERTRVCSSITPHSNIPYPEKIVELLGDEFVVIVTPADHMCKRCTSLLTHMDKLENDLKLVKNAMLSYIQKKYGILPPDQPVKGVEIVNGHLRAEEQLEQGQKRVPSGLTVRESPTMATATTATPNQAPLKLLKTSQHLQDSNKLKIYKCGFCSFQSKELGHVRFHMRTHMNKKDLEKPAANQAAAKALAPLLQQKKRLYRCQVCSKSFDSRNTCLDHIQKDHNEPTASTSNGKREAEDFHLVASKTVKLGPSNFQENIHLEESSMAVNDINKNTVDMNMMLNVNVPPTEGAGDAEQQEETENMGEGELTANSQEYKIAKAALTIIKSEPTQDEDEENAGMPEQEEFDQETFNNVAKEDDEDVENQTGDLDIESMLAAIHNDNPSTSSVGPPSKS